MKPRPSRAGGGAWARPHELVSGNLVTDDLTDFSFIFRFFVHRIKLHFLAFGGEKKNFFFSSLTGKKLAPKDKE